MRVRVPSVTGLRRLRPALVPALCVVVGALAGMQTVRNSAFFPGPLFGIVVAAVLLRVLAGYVRRHPDRRLHRFVALGVLARFALAGAHLFIGLIVYRGAVDFVGYVSAARDLLYDYIPNDTFAPFDASWVAQYFENMPSMMTILSIATMMLVTGDSIVGLFLVTASLGSIGAYLYFRAYEIACPGAPGRSFLMWSMFLLPTVAFWSIFLGKDVFVFFGLASATYAFAQVLIRGRWLYLPLLAAPLAFVFFIRPPIAAGFAVAAAAALTFRSWGWRGPDVYLVPVQRLVVGIALVVAAYGVAGEGLVRVGVHSLTLEAIAERAAEQQRGFASTAGGSALEATLEAGSDPLSVALSIPFGMFTVLFRPFIWEAHNALAVVAGIENIFLMALLLWRLRTIGRSLRAMVREPFWIFVALTFLALTVAVSFQWNFGASARLRTMGFPFLLLLAAGPRLRGAPAALPAPSPGPPLRALPGLVHYARVVWAARWAALAATVVAGIVAMASASTLPKVYSAKVTVTPPRPPAGTTTPAIGGANARLSARSLALAAVADDSDLFRAVLRSRRVRDEVLADFERRHGAEARASIIHIVPEDLTRRIKGAFVLEAEAYDPLIAATVANEYVAGLNRLLGWHAEEVAAEQRKAFIRQMQEAGREVMRAEKALLEFQEGSRRLVIGGAGSESTLWHQVRSDVRDLELRRELLRLRYTDDAYELREVSRQIAETKRRYAKLLYGHAMQLPRVEGQQTPALEFFVPGARTAALDFAFRKLALDLRIQEGFYAGALQGLQEVDYGKAAWFGTLEILDLARPPLVHLRPDRRWIVAGAVIGTLVGTAALAVLLDVLGLGRRREPEAVAT